MSDRKIIKPDPRDALCRFLLSRLYTEHEAGERLKKMGMGLREARAIIKDFRGMGLLDDVAYAQLFAEGHEDWGVARIRFVLDKRGISKERLDLALEEYEAKDEPKARRLAQNWREQGLEPLKIAARLSRRGFSNKTIGRVVGRDEDDEVIW